MERVRILVINPNSNKAMSQTLKPVLDSLHFSAQGITYDLFTAPSGPDSINNEDDAEESVNHCLSGIKNVAESYQAFLVACYSAHPLVGVLRRQYPQKHVIGIFEASVTMALGICGQSRGDETPQYTWGIVTTGKVWETLLNNAVDAFMDLKQAGQVSAKGSGRFAGVASTGMNAGELHDAPKELVRGRLTEATRKLLDNSAPGTKLKAVALGCAGMAELEEVVREVVPEDVKIVDGVKAGFCMLASIFLCRT